MKQIDKDKVLEAARVAYDSHGRSAIHVALAETINAAIEEVADQLNAILAEGEAN